MLHNNYQNCILKDDNEQSARHRDIWPPMTIKPAYFSSEAAACNPLPYHRNRKTNPCAENLALDADTRRGIRGSAGIPGLRAESVGSRRQSICPNKPKTAPQHCYARRTVMKNRTDADASHRPPVDVRRPEIRTVN